MARPDLIRERKALIAKLQQDMRAATEGSYERVCAIAELSPYSLHATQPYFWANLVKDPVKAKGTL